MTSTTPASLRDPWLAADDNLSVTEALALLGVLVWGGALVWMVVSDILKFRSRADGQHTKPEQPWQRGHRDHSQERLW